jgi:hypothetical protein
LDLCLHSVWQLQCQCVWKVAGGCKRHIVCSLPVFSWHVVRQGCTMLCCSWSLLASFEVPSLCGVHETGCSV